MYCLRTDWGISVSIVAVGRSEVDGDEWIEVGDKRVEVRSEVQK